MIVCFSSLPMASVEVYAAMEAPSTSRPREIGIGQCYEPRPSARSLAYAPQVYVDHFEPFYLGSKSRYRADFGVIRLSSRSSFECCIICIFEFFTPKKCLVPPMVFRFSGTYISAHRHLRAWRVVPFDSARRDESNGTGLISELKLRYTKLYTKFSKSNPNQRLNGMLASAV